MAWKTTMTSGIWPRVMMRSQSWTQIRAISVRVLIGAEPHAHVVLEQTTRRKTDKTQHSLRVFSIPTNERTKSTVLTDQRSCPTGDTGIRVFTLFVASYCIPSGATIPARISRPAAICGMPRFLPLHSTNMNASVCYEAVEMVLKDLRPSRDNVVQGLSLGQIRQSQRHG